MSTRNRDYIKKVKDWKWPAQLILGAMGYASMCSSPLASCFFSLRTQSAFMLIPRESQGEEGTTVEH